MTQRGSEAGDAPVVVRIGVDPLPSAAGYVGAVPGELATLIELALPPKVRGLQRERIAQRQLQDLTNLTGTDIEIRPLCDPSAPQAWTRVLMADRALVGDWRARAGAGCKVLLPDYLLLPAAPDIWTLQSSEDRLLARFGLQDGMAIDLPLAQAIIEPILHRAPPKSVLWIGPAVPELDALFESAGVPRLDSPTDAEASGLVTPAVLKNGETGCDLLADPRQERLRLRAILLPWRLPVVIALAAVLVWCVALVLETRAIQARSAAERVEILYLARTHFVPNGPLLDIRLQTAAVLEQMRQSVRERREQSSPLDLVERTSTVLMQAGTEVEAMSYGKDLGLSVSLSVPDFAAQDRLLAALSQAGLMVEVEGSGLSEQRDKVQVELVLQLKEDRQ